MDTISLRTHSSEQPDRTLTIHLRAEPVNARAEFGHRDADLMTCRKEHGPANVATVVERKSRFAILLRNNAVPGRSWDGSSICSRPLPQAARQSLPFDRGPEFVSWREL